VEFIVFLTEKTKIEQTFYTIETNIQEIPETLICEMQKGKPIHQYFFLLIPVPDAGEGIGFLLIRIVSNLL
jgi:hypothetical protein